MNLGASHLSSYPFLPEAGNYLKEKNFTLEDFNNPDLEPIISKAYDRIIIASNGQVYKTTNDPDVEIFTFLISVILLKKAGINTLIKRFSLQESRRAEAELESYLRKRFPSKTEKDYVTNLVIKIIKDVSNIIISKQDDEFIISVIDYLKNSIEFHEQEWKLVNQKVSKGTVFLSAEKITRLVRKHLELYITRKIQNAKIDSVPETFQKYVSKLSEFGQKFQTVTIDSGEYPPCVKHAIDVLSKGENLPHSGRFMLATYLLNKGQSLEDVTQIFKNAPDYNEKITTYQVNQVSKYKCPNCDKIRSESLCHEIPDCRWLVNPLQFGRKRQ